MTAADLTEITTIKRRRRRRVDRAGTPMLGYLRVSTEAQAASGLGLDAQADTIARWATLTGLAPVTMTTDVGTRRAGAAHQRKALQDALVEIREGRASGIVVAKLDRLGSGSDVVALAEEAKRDEWRLVILDINLDTSTPAGLMVVGIIAALSSFEHSRIGERNSAWKHQARIRGSSRGAAAAPRDVADRIILMRTEGLSYRAIAAALAADGVPTLHGGAWQAASVRSVEITRGKEITAQAEAAAA